MKVRVDFQLNRRFGPVEQIIFRLVLNGYSNVKDIVDALPIFSDAVIANGIKTLVNCQIISAHYDTGRVTLSEPLLAIIETCLNNRFEIQVPDILEKALAYDGLLISECNESGETLKKAILYELLPYIKLDMYVGSLDFVVRMDERGVEHG